MIPLIIHYCWFGNNPQPDIVKQCIKSWQKFMPNYLIKKWDESNIPISQYKFMKQAYQHEKFAFVSDYARYYILKENGGIFLDCDVEILKSLESLIEHKATFGFNKHIKKNIVFVNPGLFIAIEANHHLTNEILNFYDSIDFINKDGSMNLKYSSPRVITNHLIRYYGLNIEDKSQLLNNEIQILSSDYLDPINPRKIIGNEMQMTKNTYAIHHGAGSWLPFSKRVKRVISIMSREILGDQIIDSIKGKEKMTYE